MANSFKYATFKVVVPNLRFRGLSWDFVLPLGEFPGGIEYVHLMMRGREIVQEAKMFIVLTRDEIVGFGGAVSQNLGDMQLDVFAHVRRGEIECHPN